MHMSRFAGLTAVGLLAMASASTALTPPLVAEVTFESGTLTGTKQVRTNIPLVTTERARGGKYSMKAVLKASLASLSGGERNEVEMLNTRAPMNQSVWYGFSVYLPSDFVPDTVWELVAQWYPVGDTDSEWGRQPTMALITTKGRWTIENRYSSKSVTPINDSSISLKRWDLGAQERAKWTDWVVNARWTYTTDGFLKIWKDGKLVVDYKGPTSYNDKIGPFVKLGIYKGWAQIAVDVVTVRTVYHDQFRMAGSGGSYAAVAPGGTATATATVIPAAPTGIVIK
jgi:hypothetical protein